jgi:hypothetical protein
MSRPIVRPSVPRNVARVATRVRNLERRYIPNSSPHFISLFSSVAWGQTVTDGVVTELHFPEWVASDGTVGLLWNVSSAADPDGLMPQIIRVQLLETGTFAFSLVARWTDPGGPEMWSTWQLLHTGGVSNTLAFYGEYGSGFSGLYADRYRNLLHFGSNDFTETITWVAPATVSGTPTLKPVVTTVLRDGTTSTPYVGASSMIDATFNITYLGDIAALATDIATGTVAPPGLAPLASPPPGPGFPGL